MRKFLLILLESLRFIYPSNYHYNEIIDSCYKYNWNDIRKSNTYNTNTNI
jgi:hypothetical protein